MKKILFFLFIVLCVQNLTAHNQHTHQYLTIQAYKLLQRSLMVQYPAISGHLGAFEGDIGDKPWQVGMITTGAWREDEEDVVFGYRDVVNWDKGAISITHFWDPDEGDYKKNTFQLKILGVYASIGPYENAYEKITKYAYPYKCWELLRDLPQQQSITFTQTNGQPITLTTTRLGFKYNTLAELFTTGKVNITGWVKISTGQWVSCNYEVYLGQYYRDLFTWEILGRMCHLLQDMSVPAHVHRDVHGLSDDGVRNDTYEKYFGYNFGWDYYNVYTSVGQFLNPYVSSNPLHYLMNITAQMADHFGSNGPYEGDGNNIIGGNFLPEEVSFLNSVNLNLLGSPTSLTNPLSVPEVLTVRDKMIPQAIRATAGLLYWFATEVGLSTAAITPLTNVWLSGDYTLFAGGCGDWYVTLQNGMEPFTYSWQIMYLEGAGYLQTFESVKKEKEKKEKEKIKDGDVIVNAAPSNEWVSVGTNSPYFNKPHNPYDLRDFKLKCIVKDATNTTKTSNEFYVDVVSYPPEFSYSQGDGINMQKIAAEIEKEDILIPENFNMEQNFPNPFNPSTSIKFSIPKEDLITIKVFDVVGREITTLVKGIKQPGNYSVVFDGSKLSSGVYIYTLSSSTTTISKKLMLLK